MTFLCKRPNDLKSTFKSCCKVFLKKTKVVANTLRPPNVFATPCRLCNNFLCAWSHRDVFPLDIASP